MQCLHASSCRLDGHERIGLYLAVRCFAGSSALEGLLMSSDSLATTCAAKEWQCEPQRVKNYSFTSAPDKRLQAFAPFFEFERKVLLMNKVLPCNNMGRSTKAMMSDIWYLQQGIELPADYRAAGVTRLNPVTVLMWSPPCVLAHLSSHAKRGSGISYENTSHEFYVTLAAFHKKLTERGVPSIVLNYGDLLWKRNAVVAALHTLVPCLGHLNPNYVPKLNSDVFRENRFKTHGSIASYAKNHDPVQCCAYNVTSGTCMKSSLPADAAGKLRLPEGRLLDASLEDAIAYLTLHSRRALLPTQQLQGSNVTSNNGNPSSISKISTAYNKSILASWH